MAVNVSSPVSSRECEAATVDPRRRYQQVANAVAASIAGGRYKPGERLPPVRDLAIHFQVSGTTIREALIALEVRGLAECRHGSGIYVIGQRPATFIRGDIEIGPLELTEARRLFEGEAAALAASAVTEGELTEMTSLVEELSTDNVRENDKASAYRRFHAAVARATRNPAIITVVEALLDIRDRGLIGGRPRRGEHRAILIGLRNHNPRRTRNAMRAHLVHEIDRLLLATETDAIDGARAKAARTRLQYTKRLRV